MKRETHTRSPSNNFDLIEVNDCFNQLSDEGSEPNNINVKASFDRNNFAVISASSNGILRTDYNMSETNPEKAPAVGGSS